MAEDVRMKREYQLATLLQAIEQEDLDFATERDEHKKRRENLIKERDLLKHEILTGQERLPLEVEPEPASVDLYPAAVSLVRSAGQASCVLLRDQLNISVGDAVRLIDRMELDGIVGPGVGAGARPVLQSGPVN